MPLEIKFRYSIKKDRDNYLNSLYKFRRLKHGRIDMQERLLKPFPEEFKEDLKLAKDDKEADKIISDFLSAFPKKRKEEIHSSIKEFEKYWKRNRNKTLKILKDTYGKNVPFGRLTVYMTTIPICPYNFEKKWFMVFYKASVEKKLDIVMHELNHFMFLKYFGDLRDDLGLEKFETLKESLTVLTNPQEEGYPAHKELRAVIAGLKGQKMEEIITKSVAFLK